MKLPVVSVTVRGTPKLSSLKSQQNTQNPPPIDTSRCFAKRHRQSHPWGWFPATSWRKKTSTPKQIGRTQRSIKVNVKTNIKKTKLLIDIYVFYMNLSDFFKRSWWMFLIGRIPPWGETATGSVKFGCLSGWILWQMQIYVCIYKYTCICYIYFL